LPSVLLRQDSPVVGRSGTFPCTPSVLAQRHWITWIHISTWGCILGPPGTHLITWCDRIGGAHYVMRSKYCGLFCGANVRLQLSFFNAIVTSTALYAGELWGCHPRTRAERKRAAQKHCKYLRSFLRLSPSTCTSSLLQEPDQLSLHGQWFRSCIRFYNCTLCLLKTTCTKMCCLTAPRVMCTSPKPTWASSRGYVSSASLVDWT
jgi:hypothetical protein